MQKFLNKKTLIFVITLLLIGVIGLLYYKNYYKKEEKPEKQQNEKQDAVQIKERFESKIVYEQNQELEKIKKHCEELDGQFNECGSPCAPEAEICAEMCAYTCNLQKEGLDGKSGQNINWKEFNSQEFNFSLKYPVDWKMEFEEDELSPKFSFYPPEEKDQNPPFDHFKNVTHVSVYPKGIPTEGLTGETKEIAIDLDKNVSSESKSYVLENGDRFASYIKFKQVPNSWNEAGFVWSRVKIQDLTSKCLRDGEEITQNECDPFLNEDKIIRSGSINKDFLEIEEEIIKSFQFTVPINPEDSNKPVALENPQPNQKISSPLTITGQAPGTWFFEAQFPVILTDWDGKIIAETQAKAQGNWMTEELVDFKAQMEFEKPFGENAPDYMKRGSLILQKSNPSGLPENDNAKEITIFFE